MKRLGSERNCHAPRVIEDVSGVQPKQISYGGFNAAAATELGKAYT